MPDYDSNDETDNESLDSNYYDEEDPLDDIEYYPEEASSTKFNIVLCDKYDENYHGISTSEMNSHYLVLYRLKLFNLNEINDIYGNIFINSPTKIEIAECVYLNSGHCVGIIKTFWIKLIQRTWKNILKKRDLIIRKRCHPNSIRHREITGKWPKDCNNYPRLRGMLSKI